MSRHVSAALISAGSDVHAMERMGLTICATDCQMQQQSLFHPTIFFDIDLYVVGRWCDFFGGPAAKDQEQEDIHGYSIIVVAVMEIGTVFMCMGL